MLGLSPNEVLVTLIVLLGLLGLILLTEYGRDPE